MYRAYDDPAPKAGRISIQKVVMRVHASRKLLILAAVTLGLAIAAMQYRVSVTSHTAMAQKPGAMATFEFGLMGDLPYTAEQAAKMPALYADMARNPLAFVVHDGDFKSGSSRCDDATFATQLAEFQSQPFPLIYIPGHNDWTDCHRENNGAFDPLERLARLRGMFFPGNESLGRRTLTVTRQSDDPRYTPYREHMRWSMGDVTFLGLNVQGSNNNLGRSAENDAEYRERNEAVVSWLRSGFTAARSSGHRGVMVVIQANPFEEAPAQGPNGFTDFLTVLGEETARFSGQVVLVHGDSHYFRIDKPLPLDRTQPSLTNFTRVETFGSPNIHWLKVIVDPADPSVFQVRQMIVR
jgi:hypothetical protein